MFPTSGLFQDVLCPMFSTGSCDRPYCHFNHSKPEMTGIPPERNVIEIPVVNSDRTSPPPVYKPTPIKLLEQREQLPSTDQNISGLLGTVAPSTTLSSAVPVYQPTPISELEKYAPCSLTAYGPPEIAATEPPTYSPVVRQNVYLTGSLATPTYPPAFNYQPSPAYPPLSSTSPTVDSSDDSAISVGSSSHVVPDAGRNSSSGKSLKRKQRHNSTEPTSPVTPHSKSSIESTSTSSCKHSSSDEAEDLEASSGSNSSKRQKILALYKDLYGDQPLPAKLKPEVCSPKTKFSKSSPNAIAPYTGVALSRPDKKEQEKVKETSLEPKEAVDGDVAPSVILNPRPRAPLRKSDKIPMPIRTRYLDQFIEECLVIYECPNDAYDRALTDEQACHDKATSRMAYLNAVIQRLKSLKAEKLKVQSDGVRKPGSGPSQPKARLVKAETVKDEEEEAERQLNEAVQGRLLYDHLRPYILTEDQLIANGFPREYRTVGGPLGRAKLFVPEDKRSLYSTCPKNERICARCGARYLVDELGNAVVAQKCTYHWSRPVKQRIPGMGVELRYLCCQGELGQPGCQLCAEGHVHEINKWFDDEGFVATLPPLVPSCDDNTTSANDSQSSPVNVYAIDCEMVYTTAGCELGRVTIVDSKLQPVLDSIVRPYNRIIDCNTRFSGLQREEIEQSDTRITDIQSKLLHLFDTNTILLGHSLESDLVALKLIHSKVVDTSVMFPHRYGPPKKRALRNLVSEMLNRVIQQDESGHNSLEDAVACMQLVQQKVKEDLRRGKWLAK